MAGRERSLGVRRSFRWALGVVIVALVCTISDTAAYSKGSRELTIAVLSPRGSTWSRSLRRVATAVRVKSDGRLRLRIHDGGSAGGEREVARQLRKGTLDGAALTYLGLGELVPSVMVLQLPGLFDKRAQLEEVRTELYFDFADLFDQAGFSFLGWGDVGDRRLFSQRPVLTPADLAKVHPWVWKGDPITTGLVASIGGHGVPLGVLEVVPALKRGKIDSFFATAISAVALQWYRHASHMSESTQEPVIGATVLRKGAFDSLPPDLQEILVQQSVPLHRKLRERVVIEDARAGEALRKRGVKEYDMLSRADKWEKVLVALAHRLSGRVYPRPLLENVWRIARKREWQGLNTVVRR